MRLTISKGIYRHDVGMLLWLPLGPSAAPDGPVAAGRGGTRLVPAPRCSTQGSFQQKLGQWHGPVPRVHGDVMGPAVTRSLLHHPAPTKATARSVPGPVPVASPGRGCSVWQLPASHPRLQLVTAPNQPACALEGVCGSVGFANFS